MRFFIDTASFDNIKEISSWGIIEGVTTNPSLVSKENLSLQEIVKKITSIIDGPVSAEVIATDYDNMLKEARELHSIASNVVVKIPLIEDGLKAASTLKKEGIKTNLTLVFSVNQALLAAKAGATYVSPFVGRLDDIGVDGMKIAGDIVEAFDYYDLDSEVIAASIRNPAHVEEAIKRKCHVATVPYDVLKKMVEHPLTDIGIQKFLDDWNKKN
ncbi:fructose-6-phosphate aldolase [Natranaerofaba carboxydovora]|uniref:fructose-6-phosphate aldolase n=1 Tax=Natranaerofaba carboxydovora TaxID=2742683 RepID=UPI001F139729|nr:fructose-6-phosphate aldolase [Natranaerofaba carboxydovora]UMZ75133.1 Transaldolase [Natranaerofaba carboxydovora]